MHHRTIFERISERILLEEQSLKSKAGLLNWERPVQA